MPRLQAQAEALQSKRNLRDATAEAARWRCTAKQNEADSVQLMESFSVSLEMFRVSPTPTPSLPQKAASP